MLTTKQIKEIIQLKLPLDETFVTQPFGVNYADFYEKLGMKGHNGADFRIYPGMPCFAVCNGQIKQAGESGYGVSVHYETDDLDYNGQKFRLEFVYGHLKSVDVKAGDRVLEGDMLGICDNTGLYTTGDHLHFGVRLWWYTCKEGLWYWDSDLKNGYKGYIDPDLLFEDRGWKELPVMKRYEGIYWDKHHPKSRPWHTYLSEKKVAISLWRYLKRKPTNAEICAATYGAWDREFIANPSMFPIWCAMTKDDYIMKKFPKIKYSI